MSGRDVADWLSYTEALEAVLERCVPLGTERLEPDAALGRALAEDIHSRVDHPPWDNSAMDGFAVRAEDVAGASSDHPLNLPLSGDVPAGRFPEAPLRPGTAVRVMTGAPVPKGASGVIRQEHTDGGSEGAVTIHRASDAERNIRRAGEDVRRGDLLLGAGEEITPAGVGVLALTGREEVLVGRAPRVAVLANGDELAGPDELDEALAGRKIMDSNGPALAAQLRSAGAEPVRLGIARDDPDDLRRRLRALERCDALVTAAGVSVGAHDHVRRVLEELGMERVFWRVTVRPGSSTAFGVLGDKPIWGVPGNPVSALVAFEAFVRPGVRRLAGHARFRRALVPVRLREPLEPKKGVTFLHRVRLEEATDGPPWARLTGPQGSGMLTSMVAADALLLVPGEAGRLPAGALLQAVRLREWRRSP